MPTHTRTDYYELLGVPRTATEQEIKSAYRRLALKLHPDRNPGDKEAEESFKQAAEAYSVLGDPEKRRRYDVYGHAGVGGAAGFDPTIFADFGDILGDFFGFGDLFGRRRGGPRRGADLRYNLDLTFEEAAFGTETHIQIPRAETCSTCSGTGAAEGTSPTACSSCGGSGQVAFQQGFFSVTRSCGRCRGTGRMVASPCRTCGGAGHVQNTRKLQIRIPAGVDDGSQLRIAGEGEGGAAGGPPGDLYVVLRVDEHGFFRREGDSLLCEVPVSMTQAALGAQVDVPTLDGARARVTIPEGTQGGTTFRVRGQGVPRLQGKGRGDMHVTVRVVTPSKLTAAQRRLLEELSRTLPEPELSAKDRSILDKVKDILG